GQVREHLLSLGNLALGDHVPRKADIGLDEQREVTSAIYLGEGFQFVSRLAPLALGHEITRPFFGRDDSRSHFWRSRCFHRRINSWVSPGKSTVLFAEINCSE